LELKKKRKLDDSIDIDQVCNIIQDSLYNVKGKTIEGELISFKFSGSHAYITLKVCTYQLSCIYWNIQSSINFNEYKKYKDGDKVKIIGNFGISKKNLSIYFNVKSINRIGHGDYMNIYEDYRKKIISLGYNLNKKKISLYPKSIGIITAIEGAAIQDILQTFKNDNYCGTIYIKNAIVQGKQTAQSVINGIKYYENENNVDLILITRGGGSFEDLVGFSDWELIEYIHKCKIITISAVGHQIDNQLSDEVADYKFATPSIAAKFLIELQKDYINKFSNILENIKVLEIFYKKAKEHFNNVTVNLNNILYKYDLESYYLRINKMSSYVNNSFKKYYEIRKIFLEKVSNIKPTMFKEKEITSIIDFINPITKKETNPKKIDINFIDGKIKIYYKIVSYEFY